MNGWMESLRRAIVYDYVILSLSFLFEHFAGGNCIERNAFDEEKRWRDIKMVFYFNEHRSMSADCYGPSVSEMAKMKIEIGKRAATCNVFFIIHHQFIITMQIFVREASFAFAQFYSFICRSLSTYYYESLCSIWLRMEKNKQKQLNVNIFTAQLQLNYHNLHKYGRNWCFLFPTSILLRWQNAVSKWETLVDQL